MEDAHAAVLDLEGPDGKSNTFFAVYDGHGGMLLKTDLFVYLIKGGPTFSSRVIRCPVCWSECASAIGQRRILQSRGIRHCSKEGFPRHG
jgi:hypothetical protein